MEIAKAGRIVWAFVSLTLVESIVFGLSALPGLLTFQLIINTFRGIGGGYFQTALLGIAFVPSYLVFCVALMFFSAMATKAFRWRAVPGTYRVSDASWNLIRWAQYNASIHLVRLFAGGIARSTPFWSWFIRLNGGQIGRNVHINTLNIYDHNMLRFGDDVVIGSDVKISGHVGEKGRLLVAPVALGRAVTIGTNSVIYPGVVVGDRTNVGAMSLVLKDAVLPPDCTYAGVPVRLVRSHGAEPAAGGPGASAREREHAAVPPPL